MPGLLDEAWLDRGRADREPQVLGRDPPGGVAVGQRVEEDRAGDVRRDRKLAGEVRPVELLGHRRVILLDGRNVGLQRRTILLLLQLRQELASNRPEARIDVVWMDGESVGRPVSPEDVDGPGQEPDHAPDALEIAQR